MVSWGHHWVDLELGGIQWLVTLSLVGRVEQVVVVVAFRFQSAGIGMGLVVVVILVVVLVGVVGT